MDDDLSKASADIRKFFQDVVSKPLENSLADRFKELEKQLVGLATIESTVTEIKRLTSELEEKAQAVESCLREVQSNMRLPSAGQAQTTMRGQLTDAISHCRHSLESMSDWLASELSRHKLAWSTLMAVSIQEAKHQHQATLESIFEVRGQSFQDFTTICQSSADVVIRDIATKLREHDKKFFVSWCLLGAGAILNTVLTVTVLFWLR